jgi:hypothetical protein
MIGYHLLDVVVPQNVLLLFVKCVLELFAGQHKVKNASTAVGVAFRGIVKLGSSLGCTPLFESCAASYNLGISWRTI